MAPPRQGRLAPGRRRLALNRARGVGAAGDQRSLGAGRGRADPEGPTPGSRRTQDPAPAHLAGVVRELGGRPPVTVQPLPNVAWTSPREVDTGAMRPWSTVAG